MKAKKLIVLALLAILLVSTVACGGDVGEQTTPTASPTLTTPTTSPTPTPSPPFTPQPTPSPTPVPTPSPTPVKTEVVARLIEVESYLLGKGHDVEGDFRYVQGKAKNIGGAILTNVTCVMKCWRGPAAVKTERRLIGTIEPGLASDFYVRTPYDPSVDKVTIEFEDSPFQTIPHVFENSK